MSITTEHASIYKIYHGYAVEDKSEDHILLKVAVPELLPATTGGLSPAEESGSTSIPDASGTPITSRTTLSNHIVASWWGESNRKYPPTVRTGEQLEVLKSADSDKYYWRPIGRDPELRSTDVLRWEIAARPIGGSPITDDDSYFLEFDSKRKYVTLRTSDVNGEVARYTLTLDGGNGVATFGDGNHNSVTINTRTPMVRVSNADDTHQTLIQGTAITRAPLNIVTRSDNDTVHDAGKDTVHNTARDYKVTSGRDTVFDVGQDMAMAVSRTTTLSSGVSATITSPQITLNASTVTINASTVRINGNLEVTGTIRCGGIVYW